MARVEQPRRKHEPVTLPDRRSRSRHRDQHRRPNVAAAFACKEQPARNGAASGGRDYCFCHTPPARSTATVTAASRPKQQPGATQDRAEQLGLATGDLDWDPSRPLSYPNVNAHASAPGSAGPSGSELSHSVAPPSEGMCTRSATGVSGGPSGPLLRKAPAAPRRRSARPCRAGCNG